MSLSKFKQAVWDAADYYAPTLGLEAEQLAQAMFTIAGLEGGLGEEAGVGDGGASVGRFQFNTAGGHGSTLLNQGKSRKEIADDEFQAWHWAPILGKALKGQIDSGKSGLDAIVNAGFQVERPAKMYDLGRANNAFKASSSLMMGSTKSGAVNGRAGVIPLSNPSDPGSGGAPTSGSGSPLKGSLADLMQYAQAKGIFGKGLNSQGQPMNKSNFNGLGGLPKQVAGLIGGMKDPEYQGMLATKGMASKRDDIVRQMAELQAAGKPIPASLKQQLQEIDVVQSYIDGTYTPDEDPAKTQKDLLNALANVYGTAVSAGSMKAQAASEKLAAQIKQAPYMRPHEYAPGAEGNFSAFASQLPGFKQSDFKTTQFEMDDPNSITDAADSGFSGILDQILGSAGYGGDPGFTSGQMPDEMQTSAADVPSWMQDQGGVTAGGIQSSVNAFLNGLHLPGNMGSGVAPDTGMNDNSGGDDGGWGFGDDILRSLARTGGVGGALGMGALGARKVRRFFD